MKGQTCGRLPSLEVGEGGVCLLFMGFLDLEGFALSWRYLLCYGEVFFAMDGYCLLWKGLLRGLLAAHGFSCVGGVCFAVQGFGLSWSDFLALEGIALLRRGLLAVEGFCFAVEGFALLWRGFACCGRAC